MVGKKKKVSFQTPKGKAKKTQSRLKLMSDDEEAGPSSGIRRLPKRAAKQFMSDVEVPGPSSAVEAAPLSDPRATNKLPTLKPVTLNQLKPFKYVINYFNDHSNFKEEATDVYKDKINWKLHKDKLTYDALSRLYLNENKDRYGKPMFFFSYEQPQHEVSVSLMMRYPELRSKKALEEHYKILNSYGLKECHVEITKNNLCIDWSYMIEVDISIKEELKGNEFTAEKKRSIIMRKLGQKETEMNNRVKKAKALEIKRKGKFVLESELKNDYDLTLECTNFLEIILDYLPSKHSHDIEYIKHYHKKIFMEDESNHSSNFKKTKELFKASNGWKIVSNQFQLDYERCIYFVQNSNVKTLMRKMFQSTCELEDEEALIKRLYFDWLEDELPLEYTDLRILETLTLDIFKQKTNICELARRYLANRWFGFENFKIELQDSFINLAVVQQFNTLIETKQLNHYIRSTSGNILEDYLIPSKTVPVPYIICDSEDACLNETDASEYYKATGNVPTGWKKLPGPRSKTSIVPSAVDIQERNVTQIEDLKERVNHWFVSHPETSQISAVESENLETLNICATSSPTLPTRINFEYENDDDRYDNIVSQGMADYTGALNLQDHPELLSQSRRRNLEGVVHSSPIINLTSEELDENTDIKLEPITQHSFHEDSSCEFVPQSSNVTTIIEDSQYEFIEKVFEPYEPRQKSGTDNMLEQTGSNSQETHQHPSTKESEEILVCKATNQNQQIETEDIPLSSSTAKTDTSVRENPDGSIIRQPVSLLEPMNENTVNTQSFVPYVISTQKSANNNPNEMQESTGTQQTISDPVLPDDQSTPSNLAETPILTDVKVEPMTQNSFHEDSSCEFLPQLSNEPIEINNSIEEFNRRVLEREKLSDNMLEQSVSKSQEVQEHPLSILSGRASPGIQDNSSNSETLKTPHSQTCRKRKTQVEDHILANNCSIFNSSNINDVMFRAQSLAPPAKRVKQTEDVKKTIKFKYPTLRSLKVPPDSNIPFTNLITVKYAHPTLECHVVERTTLPRSKIVSTIDVITPNKEERDALSYCLQKLGSYEFKQVDANHHGRPEIAKLLDCYLDLKKTSGL